MTPLFSIAINSPEYEKNIESRCFYGGDDVTTLVCASQLRSTLYFSTFFIQPGKYRPTQRSTLFTFMSTLGIVCTVVTSLFVLFTIYLLCLFLCSCSACSKALLAHVQPTLLEKRNVLQITCSLLFHALFVNEISFLVILQN